MTKYVTDAFENQTTGFGYTKDPVRLSPYASDLPLDQSTVRALYRMNWAIKAAVEIIPQDALRQWIDINVEDEKIVTSLNNKIKELNFRNKLEEACVLSRLYGGAVILLGVLNSGKIETPLEYDNIEDIEFLNVLDRWSVSVYKTYQNPLKPNYGDPEIYKLNTKLNDEKDNKNPEKLIHESRLLRFDGSYLTDVDRITNNGWHDTELNPINQALSHYGISLQAGAILFQDFITKVLKLPNLADILTDDDGAAQLENRIQFAIANMSSLGMVLIGEEEEFNKIQTPIGGLVQLIEKYIDVFCAATKIPKTRLFGQALGTLAGATETTRNYYDMISAWQNKKIGPQITRFIKLILNSKSFMTNGNEPENWDFKFNSLWIETDKEVTTARKMQAQVDEIYKEIGVLSAEEIANNRFKPDGYSFDTHIDAKNRPEIIEALAKAAIDTAKNPMPIPGTSDNFKAKPVEKDIPEE